MKLTFAQPLKKYRASYVPCGITTFSAKV